MEVSTINPNLPVFEGWRKSAAFSADTSPMKLYENVSLVFGNGEITVQKLTLFGKVKMVKTIPLQGLRSCYQTVDSDPESPSCYLYRAWLTERSIGWTPLMTGPASRWRSG